MNEFIRRNCKRVSVLIVFCFLWGFGVQSQEKEFTIPQLTFSQLVTRLQKGGYNIYFRHAATDWSQYDQVQAVGDWTSCNPEKMRQLSDEGRQKAKEIGGAFRKLKIPIGKIYSTEYCRTKETAELFGLGKVKTSKMIMNMLVADLVGGAQAVVNRARKMFAQKPEPGTNTILVAHGNLVRDATGAYPDEAGAVIFRPNGDGSINIVAEISSEIWLQSTE